MRKLLLTTTSLLLLSFCVHGKHEHVNVSVKQKYTPMPDMGCSNITTGKIQFRHISTRLTKTAKKHLQKLKETMFANPGCKVMFIVSGNLTIRQQQRAWNRAYSIINFMCTELGVDFQNIIFQFNKSDSRNTVIFRPALPGEDDARGCSPPMFPNLWRN